MTVAADEHRIGTWVDGKPLYETTLILVNSDIPNIGYSSSYWNNVAHNISDMDCPLAFECISLKLGNDPFSKMVIQRDAQTSYVQDTNYLIERFDRQYIVIIRATDAASETDFIYVTLRYTKTTDTPSPSHLVDTSDATALANQILYSETAYARGAKLTGTMVNNGAASSTISTKAQSVSIAEGYHNGNGSVSISPTEQAKIIPENIAEGVQILGVTGTHSGGGGSTVNITPTLQSGTKIADFEIDGQQGELYAPTDTNKYVTALTFKSDGKLEATMSDGSKVTSDNAYSMTILKYGISTWNDFIEAYTAQRIVYCRASSNSNPASGSQTRMAFLAYVNNETNPTEVEFQYYRSVATHSDSQQGDQVYVYKLNKTNGWSVTVRSAFTKIAVGTGLTKSYSNGTLTISLA